MFFTPLARFIPQFLFEFEAIGVRLFLLLISRSIWFWYTKRYVNFVTCHFAESVYQF